MAEERTRHRRGSDGAGASTVIGEPVDTKTIMVTVRNAPKRVSALNLCFMTKRTFIQYEPPPNFPYLRTENGSLTTLNAIQGTPESADIEEWLEKMKFIRDDLHWVLKLPYHKFWSQVIFDENLQKCLESYLTRAPRYYDFSDPIVTEEMKDMSQEIHRLVFMVFLRMATHKESQTNHMRKMAHGQNIYNNYLFDIPKMMDLCVLYGRENKPLLSKAIENVFNTQPLYAEDLQQAVKCIPQMLDAVQQKLGVHYQSSSPSSNPIKLSERPPEAPIRGMSWEELQDIISYIVDLSATLCIFQDLYPPVCQMLNNNTLHLTISSFYEEVFTLLDEELSRRAGSDLKCSLMELRKRIGHAKLCFLKVFRLVVVQCYIQPMLENGSEDKDEMGVLTVEKFLELMTLLVSDKKLNFVCDYQLKYPFEEDAELVMQLPCSPDATRIHYILSSIVTAFDSLGRICPERLLATVGQMDNSDFSIANTILSTEVRRDSEIETDKPAAFVNDHQMNGYIDYSTVDGACAGPMLTDEELEPLVFNVLDLFPEIGYGFVEACLEYYNFDTEKVINAILENSLPDSLDKLDRNMPKKEKKSLLSERRCIYDNDEFDVFNRDTIDMSKVHKGKRDNTFQSLSSDKTAIEITKEICQRLSIVEATGQENDLLYDDEYDDTYDSNMIGPSDDTLEDELTVRRPFQKPRVLETAFDQAMEEEPEEESEEEETSQRVVRDEFVPNPAVLRERAEQRRQERCNNPKYANNVRGRPKGQGQDQSTLRSRNLKEQHKSRVANHNRRAGAEWKRRQGMIPS